MKKIIYLFITILFAQSCGDFLDVAPKGMVIPQTVEDYSLMLNKPSGIITNSCYMSPEMYLTETAVDTHEEPIMNAYLWSEFQYKQKENDENWNDLYARIYVCNEILEKIDEAESVTLNEVLRVECKGIALAERARCYFALINLYAKNYSDKNIDELGVPLITVNDLTKKLTRATVGEVYEQIVDDLISSVSLVPKAVKREEKTRATTIGVHCLLSKVYLFQNKIDDAYRSINDAFQLAKAPLVNYADFEIPKDQITDARRRSTLPRFDHVNQDIIWSGKVETNFWFLVAYMSPELVAKYDQKNDLRLYFNALSGVDGYKYDNDHSRTFAASYAEMYLLRAECHARKGNLTEAINDLNELRKNRYRIGSDYQLNAMNKTKEEVINDVKDERLREFAMTGLHLFDLKRYQSYGEEIDTYYRTYKNESYTLSPESNRYVCSIPRFVIGKNNAIIQNPR